MGGERPQPEAAVDRTEEGVGMGQGGRPRGGGAAKRCKITEEGPKQFARRARGEREEISRVAGVWRSALEGSGRGRGRRHQRAAAARVAGGLKEAVQRELHEARPGGLLLLRRDAEGTRVCVSYRRKGRGVRFFRAFYIDIYNKKIVGDTCISTQPRCDPDTASGVTRAGSNPVAVVSA